MSTAATYGGWVTDQPAATGVSPTVVRLVGWMTAAGAVLSSIGTGGELSVEHLQRSTHQMQHIGPRVDVAEAAPVRTPAEDVVRIREILKPAVSDLATTFGVSRQSVYNWLNGEPVAEENAVKLKDLAQAADVLAHKGIEVNAAMLKRKFANGRTLLQVAQAGESARDAALRLVQMHKQEAIQRERMSVRFANRGKSAPSADFDLPSTSDDA